MKMKAYCTVLREEVERMVQAHAFTAGRSVQTMRFGTRNCATMFTSMLYLTVVFHSSDTWHACEHCVMWTACCFVCVTELEFMN